MVNPWDRPPIPPEGNRSVRALYESIGRTLVAWENIEAELAHLYSALATGDRFNLEANLAYGIPNTVPLRLAGVLHAAERYQTAHPSQAIEAELDRLTDMVKRYAGRRNDIAHGVVRPFNWIITPDTKGSIRLVSYDSPWCLIPPHFRPKNAGGDHSDLAYLFTSREINAYGRVFYHISRALSNIAIWTIQHAPVPLHGIRLRPSALPYLIQVPRILRG